MCKVVLDGQLSFSLIQCAAAQCLEGVQVQHSIRATELVLCRPTRPHSTPYADRYLPSPTCKREKSFRCTFEGDHVLVP